MPSLSQLVGICVRFGSINSTISFRAVGALREFPAGLVRIPVGIEDPSDLIADLEQAFAVAGLHPQDAVIEDLRQKWSDMSLTL